MRAILLIICCTISLSASAQWYHVGPVFKKHERFPLIEQVKDHSFARLPAISYKYNKTTTRHITLDRTEYSFQAAENLVMQTAQHNMRFHVYNDASYNFTELAHLYIKQNRLSEAKWYLLQSNIISREESDDHHTVANLIDLAMIKSSIGEYEMAMQDITEAHDIATAKGFRDDVLETEKKMLYIKQNKLSPPRTDLRYAELPDAAIKADK